MIFVYCAWFRNEDIPPEEEDYEWPAVFEIEAETAESAQQWGDFLSSRYMRRNRSELFLWSEIRLPNDPTYADFSYESPRVQQGQDPEQCDLAIGWAGWPSSDEEIQATLSARAENQTFWKTLFPPQNNGEKT